MRDLTIVLIALFVISCNNEPTNSEETSDDTIFIFNLQEVWTTDTTSLITPESVIYDTQNEVYYVSCINAVPPTAKDGDGYLAILNKDGSLNNANWIEGMDAPKGMGIIGDKLYVTDITRVHEINIESGKIIESYDIEGSEFLNDITVNNDEIFISDSNTSTIYKLIEGEISPLVQNDAFGGSNGLLYDNNSLLVAGFGSGDFHKVDLDGQNPVLLARSIPSGDGIVKFEDTYIVSNWNGEIFSVGNKGTTYKMLDTKSDNRNTADISIGSEPDLLIVPEFFGNRVTAYKIK